MTAEQPDRLLVNITGGTAYIKVVGRGSFKVSTALKQFGAAAIDAHCNRMVLEMSECIGMDSTFMGVLAGLAFRLRQQAGGAISMINLSLRTRGLLATLGLDQIIQPFMAGATAPDNTAPAPAGLDALAVEEPSPHRTAETMLEAHENLVRLSPENLPKFKDVLAFLREDLKRPDSPGREQP